MIHEGLPSYSAGADSSDGGQFLENGSTDLGISVHLLGDAMYLMSSAMNCLGA